ncbi:hypothetical protein SAMN02745704_00931 [Paucidesulfovibrio gracilis DSM 16080]|uniref:Alpha-2-macroglobulin family N-terminal region n=1 Tax=Paucidesulfovibrio gracilis DSM 16080 TaxID=1121449 RepID=A0A1T4WJH9_9BACT|nr:alpha-2-macroglobulin [Paucidesulfovibrio gracilis]SKA77058.1 hypothetical protein SAMN02745704_00931 [Paucidesulfovibrio gracilis DSM 16080]
MSATALAAKAKDVKNILIILLLLVVAVETFLLLGGNASKVGTKDDPANIAVTETTINIADRRDITLEFSYPLGKGRQGQPVEAPAVISPDHPGEWHWTGPYSMTYRAEEPFQLATRYTVKLHPEKFLKEGQTFTGDRKIRFKTGNFSMDALKLHATPAEGGPTLIHLEGSIRFNAPVLPEDFLNAVSLNDPLSETPLEITVLNGWRSREINFRSAPVEKLPQPRELTLRISGKLRPQPGSLALGHDEVRTFPVVLDPVLHAQSVDNVPQGNHFNIKIDLSTAVDSKRSESFVQVTPPTEYRLTSDGNSLFLRGEFMPGQEYQVRLQEGLRAVDGAVLQEAWNGSLRMPDLPPSAGFVDDGMFLSRNGARNLSLETVNTDRVELTVDRVYRNNLFWLFADYGWTIFDPDFNPSGLNQSLGDRIKERSLHVSARKNEPVRTSVDLGDVIQGNAPGFYRVGMTLPGSWWGKQRWVLVTDLGMVAKRGTNELLVWVNSFSTLAPQPGVRMTLRSQRNQVLAQGRTDGNGLWRVRDLNARLDGEQAFLITAEQGDDFSFLLPDSFRVDTTGLDVGGSGFSQRGLSAFLYGERDIYRPGETMQGAAIIRDQRLQAPPSLPLTLRHIDPEGRVLDTRILRTNKQGLVDFSREIPEYALTGHYIAQLEAGGEAIGQYRYQVEEFVPDRIKVTIRPGMEMATPGSELTYDVESRYLFGPPAQGLNLETRVMLRPMAFGPAGYRDFVFGDPDKKFPNTEIFALEDASLNEKGTQSFRVSIPEGLTPPAALEAHITARVREHGGRGVSGAQGVPVHVYPRYPGLGVLDRNAYTPGEPVVFRYVLITPDGTPAEGQLKAGLYKDEWQTVVRRTPSGGFRYESSRDPQLIDDLTIQAPKSAGEERAVGSFRFTPEEFGSYRVMLTDTETGASSELSFYCGGWGFSPWAMENPARIDIQADKDEYRAGDTATFQLRTPFSGKALVTVESREVLETRIVNVTGNTAQVRFQAKAAYAPNVYVTAILLRQAGELRSGEAARAFGAVPFNVNRATNQLSVGVKAPEQVQPGESIEVTATTAPGSAVTIAAVDEGILRLIAQKTPNPFEFFYAKRRLDVDSFDIFSMLFPEPNVEGNAPAGGGRMMAAMADYARTEGISRVKPVTFWSGPLTADAQGVVHFAARAPEGFQGGLRIMAVAADGSRFGSGSMVTRIKSPISATPTFPRFLALDEQAIVPVTVRNDTTEEQIITLNVSVEGPADIAEHTQDVTVRAGREQTIPLSVQSALEEGTARFTVSADNGETTFRTTTDVPVRTAYPFEYRKTAGTLKEQSLVLPETSAQLVPSTVRRELHAGSLPLIRYSSDLRDLLAYPYGCAEQIASRAFPLLRFGELASTLAPDLVSTHGPEFMVQDALQRLMSMQTGDGGFAFWPGMYESDAWLSLYVTHFLIEAQRAGFTVPNTCLDPALSYTASLVKNQNPRQQSGLERITYGLYTLARSGVPDRGMMHFLAEQHRDQLDAQTGTLLASAFASVGDMETYDTLLAKVEQLPEGERERGGNLGSPLRDQALILLALLDTAPDDPRVAPAVQKVSELMAQGTHTTQENAMGLCALGAFFKRQRSHTPFNGRILLNDTELGTFTNEEPLHLRDVGPGELRIELDAPAAPGAVLYSLQTRGAADADSYQPASQGMEVRRSLLDRDGAPVSDQITQGDLLVMKLDIRSRAGTLPHLAIQALLPTGLEVENPRLATTERLDWMKEQPFNAVYQDLRDDRVLFFGDLPFDTEHPDEWQSLYVLVRAVTSGRFTLPPVRAEVMYDPGVFAQSETGTLDVAKDF